MEGETDEGEIKTALSREEERGKYKIGSVHVKPLWHNEKTHKRFDPPLCGPCNA